MNTITHLASLINTTLIKIGKTPEKLWEVPNFSNSNAEELLWRELWRGNYVWIQKYECYAKNIV